MPEDLPDLLEYGADGSRALPAPGKGNNAVAAHVVTPTLNMYPSIKLKNLFQIYLLSWPTNSTVILLRRKFIYDKSSSGMLINPPIVFTFTRRRWSSTTFSVFLALLV